MKSWVWLITFSLMAVGAASPGQAEVAQAKAGLPVLVTSCGQSPGPVKLKVFMKRLSIDHVYDLGATAATIESASREGKPFGSVIIVTGASLKGMGAAGVSIADEIARVEALMAAAHASSVTIVAAHIEGMARRSQGASAGDNSDEMSIDAVCTKADVLLARQDGNSDGRFSAISTKRKIPLITFEKNLELGDVLTALFAR